MKGIQASNVIIISYVYIYITGDTSYFDIWNVEGKRRATKYVLSNICIFHFSCSIDLSKSSTWYVLS